MKQPKAHSRPAIFSIKHNFPRKETSNSCEKYAPGCCCQRSASFSANLDVLFMVILHQQEQRHGGGQLYISRFIKKQKHLLELINRCNFKSSNGVQIFTMAC
jgi:hypothetical protein